MTFNYEWVPLQDRCRWFVRYGATTKFNRGFRSKEDASNWINSLGSRLDFRVGFIFRLKGDDRDVAIVNRHGDVAGHKRGDRVSLKSVSVRSQDNAQAK